MWTSCIFALTRRLPLLPLICLSPLCITACVAADAEENPAAPLAASPAQESIALPTAEELEQAGAVIGEISIDAQNIFDLSDPRENRRLFRLADRLHMKTRARVVEKQLLFKSGDPYSQRELDESARILRSARYIYDATVQPVAVHDGKVDVAVTTRDVWTLNPGLSFGRKGGKSTSGFELEDLNILGTGSSLSAGRKSGVDRDSTLFEFKDPHLGDSWTSMLARYANNSDGSQRGLSFDRPFYALDTHWAAGVSAADDERIEPLYDLGHVVDKFRERSRVAQMYGGWSAGLQDGWTRRWTIGATFDDRRFDAAPGWTGPINLIPEDRKLIYPWIGFELVQDDYRELKNRDQIGRTEDFYLGTRFSTRLGWAGSSFGSDRDALMFSATAGHGLGPSSNSMLLLRSSLDGRLERGELRNTVLDGSIRYYLKQSERRLFFTTLEGAVGRNLDLDNQILLGGDNGLRGYPLRYQAGESRVLLTVEQRYFTDWYPFRLFRIGGAAFFDIGRTWGDSPVSTLTSTSSQGLLKDIGIGLRIGNSRSGLGNIIHVDIALPLDGDPSISKVQFLVETRERF
jgi:outer membrane protein assembly factor BamA